MGLGASSMLVTMWTPLLRQSHGLDTYNKPVKSEKIAWLQMTCSNSSEIYDDSPLPMLNLMRLGKYCVKYTCNNQRSIEGR